MASNGRLLLLILFAAFKAHARVSVRPRRNYGKKGVALDMKAPCAVCDRDCPAATVVLPCGHRLHTKCHVSLLEESCIHCPACGDPFGRSIVNDAIAILRNGSLEVRENATAHLRDVATRPENHALILEGGGIKPLVEILLQGRQENRPQVWDNAVFALGFLATDGQERNLTLEEENGAEEGTTNLVIQSLLKILKDGSQHEAARVWASAALTPLALWERAAEMIREADGIPVLLHRANKKKRDDLRQDESIHSETRARSLLAVSNMAMHEPCATVISELGGVQDFISIMNAAEDQDLVAAASVGLQNIVQYEQSSEIIRREKGITALIQQLQDDEQTDAAKSEVARSLAVMAGAFEENREAIFKEGGIPVLIRLMKMRLKETQDTAAAALINLAQSKFNREQICQAGGIQPLIDVLTRGSPQGAAWAAAALGNLAEDEDTADLICKGRGIRPLIKLVQKGNEEGQAYAANALGKCGDKSKFGDIVRKEGAIRSLIVAMNAPNEAVQMYAAAALGNLSNHSTINRAEIREKGGIPILLEILHNTSHADGQQVAALTLGVLASDIKNMQLIQKGGGVETMAKFLRESSPEVYESSGIKALVEPEPHPASTQGLQVKETEPLLAVPRPRTIKEVLLANMFTATVCSYEIQGYGYARPDMANRRCGTCCGSSDINSTMCSGATWDGDLHISDKEMQARCNADKTCVGYSYFVDGNSYRPVTKIESIADDTRWQTYRKTCQVSGAKPHSAVGLVELFHGQPMTALLMFSLVACMAVLILNVRRWNRWAPARYEQPLLFL